MKKVLLLFIHFYQYCISPFLGKNCRHEPTCSNYMKEAIIEWGVFKGVFLGLNRLRKCHPWGTIGYDPVPKNNNKKI